MRSETDFAGRQFIGSREKQEDYYGFCPLAMETDGLDGLLLVLADGMGAYAGGSLASRLVVESFIESFCFSRGDIPQRLHNSLRASERRLHEEIARQDERLSQMGTTLVAAVWTPGNLHWVSVGDSMLYLYRGGQMRRLNADHSMAPVIEELAARGEITAEEAAHHPDRNALRSALADRPLDLFDLRDLPFELAPGDLILAASDGLSTVSADLLPGHIAAQANRPAGEIAEALLVAVSDVRKPKQDNATVAVIRTSNGTA